MGYGGQVSVMVKALAMELNIPDLDLASNSVTLGQLLNLSEPVSP